MGRPVFCRYRPMYYFSTKCAAIQSGGAAKKEKFLPFAPKGASRSGQVGQNRPKKPGFSRQAGVGGRAKGGRRPRDASPGPRRLVIQVTAPDQGPRVTTPAPGRRKKGGPFAPPGSFPSPPAPGSPRKGKAARPPSPCFSSPGQVNLHRYSRWLSQKRLKGSGTSNTQRGGKQPALAARRAPSSPLSNQTPAEPCIFI